MSFALPTCSWPANVVSCIITGNSFIGLVVVLLAGVGPLGDVLILAATPSMLKHAGKSGHFRPLLTS